eukprot:COSAG01_NODE_554_length_15534_cov_101.167541_1_plen_66_part_10
MLAAVPATRTRQLHPRGLTGRVRGKNDALAENKDVGKNDVGKNDALAENKDGQWQRVCILHHQPCM